MVALQFFVTLCLKVALSLVPEVSQEGLLQPYITYSDVSLFHYHVPPEVERVTWEFAAFMDDPNCPIRDVHVLVQHGSYPVFSANNDSFPSYMYKLRSSLQKVTTRTAYQPHDATLLSIYNPLPGSWFAAAYIPNWNEQMQQEGLVHKCRYSLGSVAMWTENDRIQTLNIGLPQDIVTQENLSYFRFYVPSHTWLVEVKVTECRIQEDKSTIKTATNGTRWCIRSAALRARALPDHRPDIVGVANITEGGQHVFLEKHPYTDSYYYLLVFTEGETKISVVITTKECGSRPKRAMSSLIKGSTLFIANSSDAKLQLRMRQHNSSLNETSDSIILYSESSTSAYNGSSSFPSSSSPSVQFILTTEQSSDYEPSGPDDMEPQDEEGDEEHRCFPILPLARIKHSRDFTDTFLVQGPEWFSTWVSVHGETPVFTHMTLLPYTDIGGTLSITLHLDELLLNVTNQLISVIGCVKKGRPPFVISHQLDCDDDLTLNISTASLASVEDFLLIPFPEPDVWYLALHVLCYHEGVRTPCIVAHVMVSIDVRTQPCVYAGEAPCGTHGICQETHRGMFFFSSCNCLEGWRGWGCHDGQHAQTLPSFLSAICLLTASNVFFVPAILLAAKWRFFSQALLFSATMIASIFYHACDSEVFSYCLTRYEVLQFTDFFFSLLCFWVTIVNLCGVFSGNEMAFLHLLGVIIIAPAVQYSRTALLSFILPMGIAVAIPLSKVLYRRVVYREWPTISRQRLLARCLGGGLALAGLCLFALIQTKENYKYVHSAWHMAIAISLMFLLPSKATPRPMKRRGHPPAASLPRHPPNSFSYLTSHDGDDDALIDVTAQDDVTSSPVFQSCNVAGGSGGRCADDVDLIVFGADADVVLCSRNDGAI